MTTAASKIDYKVLTSHLDFHKSNFFTDLASVMSTTTELRQPSAPDLEFRPGDKIPVLHQLREFRSQVPKNILRSWEEPTGYAAFL